MITQVVLSLTRSEHKLSLSYGAIKTELAQMNIDTPTIKDVSNAVINIRMRKLPDPQKIGNSGSFFKNPIIPIEHYEKLLEEYPELPSYPIDDVHVKLPAAWLIDRAGWKGKRIGDAGCYQNQALVLVNHGNAKGEEILNLALQIIKDVQSKYNISLTPEVNIL